MHIGYNIKRIREMKGYSQKAIANKLGMSVTGYGNIERGVTEVRDKRLNQIAKVLDVSITVMQNFNADMYLNPLSLNQHDIFVKTNTINSTEKELYQKIIQQKDEEITYLRNLLKKKN